MRTVLFDLDGTLLPMDTDAFERAYFKGLCEAINEVPPDQLIREIWAGTEAMIKNDGSVTNREAFAEAYSRVSAMDFYANEERFEEFYRTGFNKCAEICEISDVSRHIVDELKAKGYSVSVATNPIFPMVATRSRLRWIGLSPEEFGVVTTYENSHYAKPNPQYFREVCEQLGEEPENCVMIGNDVEEDGAARKAGIPVILVTDHLKNEHGLPTDDFEQMTLAGVLEWARALPALSRRA